MVGRHEQFGLYKGSPIEQLLSAAITTIPRLRDKYAADAKTIEKVHADAMLKGLEGILTTLHESTFPYFENGRTDINLLALALPMRHHTGLVNTFVTREWVLYEAVKEMIPGLLRTAKRNADANSLPVELTKLLDAHQENLFTKARQIPSYFKLEDTFAFIKKMIVEQKLYAHADSVKDRDIEAKRLDLALFDYGAPYGYSAVNSYHPAMYEFTIELTKQFMQLPRELRELIPFINPACASRDFTGSGIVATLMRIFSPRQANLQHKPNPPGEPLSYNFNLTLVPPPTHPDDVQDGDYDGAAYYSRYYHFALSAMLRQIRSFPETCAEADRANMKALQQAFMQFSKAFYEQNADKDFVRSDRARADFLPIFLREKKEECEKIIAEAPVIIVNDDLQGMELITALHAAKERERIRQSHYQSLMSMRKSIERELLSYFIPQGSELYQRLQADKQKGLDVSYAESPVPDDIFDFSDPQQLNIIPFKSAYRAAVEGALENLQFDRHYVSELDERIQRAKESWVSKRLNDFQMQRESLQDQALPEMSKALQRLTSATMSDSDHALFDIQQRKVDVQALAEQANQLLQEARDAIQLSDEDRALDSQALQDGVMKEAQAVEKCVEAFIQKTNIATQALCEAERQQEHAIAKAKEEEAFQNSLREQGPDKLKELIADETRALQALSDQILVLTRDTDLVNANLASIEARLNQACDDSYRAMAVKDAAVDQECQLILERAQRIIPHQCQASPVMIDDCLAWVHSEIKQIADVLKDTQEDLISNVSNKVLQQNCLLEEVKATLAAKKKKTLTFAEIRALTSVQKFADKKDGFAFVLELVGYSAAEVAEWLELEAQQKKILKRSKKICDARLQALTDKIDSVMTQNRLLIDQHAIAAGIPTLLQKRDALRGLHRELQVLAERKVSHHIERMNANALKERGMSELAAPRADHENAKRELAALQLTANKKRDTIKLSQLNIDLLEGLLPLRELITVFENIDVHFNDENSQDAYSVLYTLCHSVQQLQAVIDQAASDIIVKQPVPPLLASAQTLLHSAKQNIARSIENKLSPELLEMNAIIQVVQSMCDHPPSMAAMLEPYDRIFLLGERRDKIFARLATLKNNVQGPYADIYLDVIEQHEAKIILKWRELQMAIKNKLSETISDCHDEVIAKQTRLQAIAEAYRALSPTAWLSQDHHDELKQLVQNFRELYQEAASAEAIVAKIHSNMEAIGHLSSEHPVLSIRDDMLTLRHQLFRTELAVTWRENLSVYLTTRKIQYLSKDRFFSHDKADREAYVQQQLMAALTAYVDNGDLEALLVVVQRGHDKFFGKQFRSLLNNMIVSLVDFERNCSPGQKLLSEQPPTLAMLHREAMAELNALPDDVRMSKFSASIKNLYADIESLRNKAVDLSVSFPHDSAKINQLADDLQKDVDRYLISGPTEGNDANDKYQKFSTVFNARLHSQDEVLSRHRSLWPTAFNIIVGICTVGIALLACLLVTKLTYGRATLFFNDTSPLKRNLDRLEDTANDDVGFYLRA